MYFLILFFELILLSCASPVVGLRGAVRFLSRLGEALYALCDLLTSGLRAQQYCLSMWRTLNVTSWGQWKKENLPHWSCARWNVRSRIDIEWSWGKSSPKWEHRKTVSRPSDYALSHSSGALWADIAAKGWCAQKESPPGPGMRDGIIAY